MSESAWAHFGIIVTYATVMDYMCAFSNNTNVSKASLYVYVYAYVYVCPYEGTLCTSVEYCHTVE